MLYSDIRHFQSTLALLQRDNYKQDSMWWKRVINCLRIKEKTQFPVVSNQSLCRYCYRLTLRKIFRLVDSLLRIIILRNVLITALEFYSRFLSRCKCFIHFSIPIAWYCERGEVNKWYMWCPPFTYNKQQLGVRS